MAGLTDYGFPFNSAGGDRTYNASVFRDYFKNIITDGIIQQKLNEMLVVENDTPAKNVKVSTGYVFIQGVQYGIETAQVLVIADNSAGSTRYDRVVARVDYTGRLVELAVLQGVAGGGLPALTQTTETYEIALATVTCTNGFTTITNAVISDERPFANLNYAFFQKAVMFKEVDLGNSGTAKDIDWETNGNKQSITLTGNCAITFDSLPASSNLQLKLKQDATGSRLVTWQANVKWAGGIIPTLSTTAGSIDIVSFYYSDIDDVFYGSMLPSFS